MDPSYLESPVVEGAKKLLAYFAVVSRLSFAHAQQSLLTRTAHTHTHTHACFMDSVIRLRVTILGGWHASMIRLRAIILGGWHAS